MSDEDLVRAKRVPVRASRRGVGDPLAGRGLQQLASTSITLSRRVLAWHRGAADALDRAAGLQGTDTRRSARLTFYSARRPLPGGGPVCRAQNGVVDYSLVLTCPVGALWS